MTRGARTQRLTMAQALVRFLKRQYAERDERRVPFFVGVWGIFGHGNVAGIGQALQENPDLRYYLPRNEQAMVHTAAAFARMTNRLQTFACTSSIGPGATNMVTAAAGATINRLPVLLLPGDIFARRNVAPVLQQLEASGSQDISVNDCFKPVSRYWDRITRPEQLLAALPEALRVLTSPAETGAVTLALPQDVQAEAYDYPTAFFQQRVWHIPRSRPDRSVLQRAAECVRKSKTPCVIAGGGVIYSEATDQLSRFAEATGIPVAETHAGKGALRHDHPQNLGAIGVTGTLAANRVAREADLVISIGTRLGDFATASTAAFQNPAVRFINVNVAEFDAHKRAALPVVGDARVVLEELSELMRGFHVSAEYGVRIRALKKEWEAERERIFRAPRGPLLSQAQVIDIVNSFSGPRDVVVAAAGTLPGDLHKLWRARDPKSYHVEYGYSCMGYEVSGGLGVKMAAPDRDVYVLIGDGSYLMMSSEIVTAVQEGVRLTIILLNNHGFASIRGLSESTGSGGFGTAYRSRDPATGQLEGDVLPVDFVASARGFGAHAISAATGEDLLRALEEARGQERTTVIVVDIDPEEQVPSYESWWDVPVAEVSSMDSVRWARAEYEQHLKEERHLFP